MKIVKYAKYGSTMFGPEGYFHRWTAPRKKYIQRTRKINGTSKSLAERLIDFKKYALSVLRYLGSISAPDGATVTRAARPIPLGPTMPYLLTYYVRSVGLDLCAALVPTYLGSVSLGLLRRFRTAANSNTRRRPCKNQCSPRIRRCLPYSPLHPNEKKSF